jgi:hypothetical protein
LIVTVKPSFPLFYLIKKKIKDSSEEDIMAKAVRGLRSPAMLEGLVQILLSLFLSSNLLLPISNPLSLLLSCIPRISVGYVTPPGHIQ